MVGQPDFFVTLAKLDRDARACRRNLLREQLEVAERRREFINFNQELYNLGRDIEDLSKQFGISINRKFKDE